MSADNYFTKLAQINVQDHVEKKGRFSYLSWPWAVSQLKSAHPDATWEIKRFGDDRLPYMKTECGYFVEVEVTVDGIPHQQIHPVLNNMNKPIDAPSAFDINTSIQRALVKAIALHGLGLYIYAGEDLPMDTDNEMGVSNLEREQAKESYQSFVKAMDSFYPGVSKEEWQSFKERARDAAKKDLWSTGSLKTFGTKLDRKEKELFPVNGVATNTAEAAHV